MNPAAMEPIGGAGQGMDEGANADPGANMEADNSGEPAKIAGFKYCIVPTSEETYSVYTEAEAEGSAEGAAMASAEGGENEANEGEKSLGEGLSLIDSFKAVTMAEKSRLSGGEAETEGSMDAGFKGEGGGAVHA